MQKETKAFRIYDASAGSGKTFTLAREYLILLLRADSKLAYRQILAITFTNKAVGELKERILNNLMAFASIEDAGEVPSMFKDVQEALGIDPHTLIRRSHKVLEELLHNYAFFDVSTIDKFNHRILRTFSQDLELPSNFEVVLDTDSLLEKAVDSLVAKAGIQSGLTEVLIDFALEKTEEDRHWDISRDLFEMGKLLFDENHHRYLDSFAQKTFEDFLKLKKQLGTMRKSARADLKNLADGILSVLEVNNLETTDFTGGYFPKFIRKISDGASDQDFNAKWKQNFGQEPPYPRRVPEEKQVRIDELLPLLTNKFNEIRQYIYHLDFLGNAYQNTGPFTVLGMLQKELKTLQDEEGFLPISSFNAIIARELRNQPAPYIYERLGERYRHYFIDEFQDTSELQWTNLVPLISNALQGEDEQGEQGSLVLVGDAKQAIYRWRGGKAEQFLNIIEGSGNPFAIKPEIKALPKNYRSHRQVIEFNNDFFAHISGYLSQDSYSELFIKGSNQIFEQDKPGLVSIDFIPADTTSLQDAYLQKTYEIIKELKEEGYSHRDICILTRRKQEGVALSNYLIHAEIPVMSSETLLLRNHPDVQFLIHLLNYLLAPEDKNHAFGILALLSQGKPDRHEWIRSRLDQMDQFLLNTFGFDPERYRLKPVYELLEVAIGQFDLGGKADAYLTYLMDLVLEVSSSQGTSIQEFLDYWKEREDTFSILAPQGFDAITLMTIHKSKGLEFPVVIYPFADTAIYWDKNAKIWLPVDPDSFSGFQNILVGKKKALLNYEDPAPEYYEREHEKLELDAFNLLYVAHTRAIKALYVVSKSRNQKEALGTPMRYGDLYTLYLREKDLWKEGRGRYQFGALDTDHISEELQPKEPVVFRHSSKPGKTIRMVTKSGQLWGSEQEEALAYGNILHHALSLLISREDIDATLDRLILDGCISQKDREGVREILYRLVEHPLLIPYFEPGLTVLNEQEILTENGLILRPDRLVIRPDGISVIDYKTGQRRSDHREQVLAYKKALVEAGHIVKSAIIIYISEEQITPELI